MPEASVTLVNPLGLHARAAAKVVRLANEFESAITIMRPNRGRTADARSIGGDIGRLDPRAVRVAEEVVARLDGLVHPRRLDSGLAAGLL